MKARSEAEVLEHMSKMTVHGSGQLSNRLRSWTQAKVEALRAMDRHCQVLHGRHVESILDVGVGDMAAVEEWEGFEAVDYMGVDGCPEVLERAKRRHPDRDFYTMTFSDLLLFGAPEFDMDEGIPDAILLMDVLYHIPDQPLAEGLVRWAAGSPAEYLVVTHATDPTQVFDQATKAGEPGFAWFPHPFSVPDGWDVIHQEDSREGVQSQRVLVLARNSVE